MNVQQITTDAVVVGAGPAGLSLTYELMSRGVEVLCVAPALAPWAPNYGLWLDEVADIDVPLAQVWDRARVSFQRYPTIDLERPYGRVDSAALYDRWSSAVIASDQFLPGVVTSALFSGDFHEIRLESGVVIRARQLFDASGHDGKLVLRNPTSPAVQTAFGAHVRVVDNTMSQDTMGLMLWDDGVVVPGRRGRSPAFYYVMPGFDGSTFSEYTVLASRPLVGVDLLEARLRRDCSSGEISEQGLERCFIPMGYSVPSVRQPVVGFGGAASMVHPATGYMIARTLLAAPQMAEAYLEARLRSGDERARALWEVIWPEERARSHELYRFGLEALLTMDVDETQSFFSAFFNLPDGLWRTYQSGAAAPADVAATMWAVFRAVGPGLKVKLARAGFGPHAAKLSRLIR